MKQKRLLIYLNDSSVEWAQFDQGVLTSASEASLSDVAPLCKDHEVIVFIPGQDVLFTKAELPKLNRQRLRQALPFALEEQLIHDVQDLHFAFGDYIDGHQHVAVIERARLSHYLEILTAATIQPHTLYALNALLPSHTTHWEIALTDETAIVRVNATQSFAVEVSNLKTFLALELKNHVTQPECLEIHNFNATSFEGSFADLPHNIIQHSDRNMLNHFGASFTSHHAINLLQHEFAAKQRTNLSKKLGFYSVCFAIAWVGIGLVSKVISYFILQGALNQTDLAINTIYKKHFPAASSIVAPRDRMAQKLKTQTSGSGQSEMLDLLAKVGKSLHNTPSIHVKQFDFREHTLNVTVTTSSFNQLDQFINALHMEGAHVKQQSAGIVDTEAKASLLITTGEL